ncbi:hypothetical protein LguiA_004627 [Lonicera macranthoides]
MDDEALFDWCLEVHLVRGASVSSSVCFHHSSVGNPVSPNAYNVNCHGAFCPKSKGAANGVTLRNSEGVLVHDLGKEVSSSSTLMSECLAISDACDPPSDFVCIIADIRCLTSNWSSVLERSMGVCLGNGQYLAAAIRLLPSNHLLLPDNSVPKLLPTHKTPTFPSKFNFETSPSRRNHGFKPSSVLSTQINTSAQLVQIPENAKDYSNQVPRMLNRVDDGLSLLNHFDKTRNFPYDCKQIHAYFTKLGKMGSDNLGRNKIATY